MHIPCIYHAYAMHMLDQAVASDAARLLAMPAEGCVLPLLLVYTAATILLTSNYLLPAACCVLRTAYYSLLATYSYY
eukprot:scaffold38671_cov57-Phaeocystis_antarctica.AAC.2